MTRSKDSKILFLRQQEKGHRLSYTEVNKFNYKPKDENNKKASMKYLFLARFAKEGRTLEAAYNA